MSIKPPNDLVGRIPEGELLLLPHLRWLIVFLYYTGIYWKLAGCALL